MTINMAVLCQVVHGDGHLTCPAREGDGRGWRCEVIGSHIRHRIGDHTIRHALAGNGYACDGVPQWIR